MGQMGSQAINTSGTPVGLQPRVPKKQQALDLYRVHAKTLIRDQIVDLFMTELDIPENTARTYASWCAKELNEELGLPYARRKRKEITQVQQTADICAENQHISRREVIDIVSQRLNITPENAATHVSIATKVLGVSPPG